MMLNVPKVRDGGVCFARIREDRVNRAAGSFLISSHPCADCERPRRHLCFQLFLYLYESLQLLARKPLHGFKISVEAMHILPK